MPPLWEYYSHLLRAEPLIFARKGVRPRAPWSRLADLQRFITLGRGQ
jgi:hypothetical protein